MFAETVYAYHFDENRRNALHAVLQTRLSNACALAHEGKLFGSLNLPASSRQVSVKDFTGVHDEKNYDDGRGAVFRLRDICL